MKKSKSKITKKLLVTIITVSVFIVIMLSLIITNIFIPVKYLSDYAVKKEPLKEGTMRVAFIDVGYGDCTVVEFPDGRNMLLDGGNGRYTNNSKILKYLNKCGIDTIDFLVCTSVKGQYCGGLSEIMRYKDVNTVYAPYCKNVYVTEEYKVFNDAVEKSGAEVKISEYGAGGGNSENGFFTFLSPSVHTNPQGEYSAFNLEQSNKNTEAISAVVWLEYCGTSFLLTGGANDTVLTNLCNSYSVAGKDFPVQMESCTILKVAAQGNKYSACAMLYDLIKPRTAIMSVGENGYGCPSVQALSNALNYANNFYRTDEHGTVVFEVSKNGFKAYGEKL